MHAKVLGEITGLIEGMNVTAVISLEQTTVQAVPTEAIVNVNGQEYIFMLVHEAAMVADKESLKETGKVAAAKNTGTEKVGSGMTFQRIAVAKGKSNVGYTEITLLHPIPANAKIVVKGAFFVSAKMTNVENQ